MSQDNGPCILVAASPLHDKHYLSRVAGFAVKAAGQEAGQPKYAIGETPGLEGCNSLLVLVATGGTEETLIGIDRAAGSRPVYYLALPYANGLPALMEAAPLVTGKAKRRALGVLPCIDCERGVETIRGSLRALRAAGKMNGARLGLIGGPSPWLVYSVVPGERLREKLGVELVEIGMDTVVEEYRASSGAEAERLLGEILAGARKTLVGKRELVKALRLYLALKRLAEKHKLDAITVKCFDIIPLLDTTACLPLSLLNSQGIVAGCEGDVPAALAMMASHWATGSPVFMGNPASIEEDRVLIAHCTAPIALTNAYELKTHFETGRGVGVAIYFPEGIEASLLRLSPSLDRARLLRGIVVKGKPESPLHCRSQLWVRIDVGHQSLEELLLEKSMGNHYVAVLGPHHRVLRDTLKLLGLELETA